MTKTRPFLSTCYGYPSTTEVPPCCQAATKKLTFSTTSVLLLLNVPLSLSRGTVFRRPKNPRRGYRPEIAGILFVYNESEGKYYTVPKRQRSNSDQDDGCNFDGCIDRASDLVGHTSRAALAEHGTAPDRPRRGTSRNLAHASEKVSDNKWHVDAETLGWMQSGICRRISAATRREARETRQ